MSHKNIAQILLRFFQTGKKFAKSGHTGCDQVERLNTSKLVMRATALTIQSM